MAIIQHCSAQHKKSDAHEPNNGQFDHALHFRFDCLCRKRERERERGESIRLLTSMLYWPLAARLVTESNGYRIGSRTAEGSRTARCTVGCFECQWTRMTHKHQRPKKVAEKALLRKREAEEKKKRRVAKKAHRKSSSSLSKKEERGGT